MDGDRDLYLWASTIISSRAFTAKVLASVIPTLQQAVEADRVSVLLPLIDATNHKPLAKVEWRAGTDSIGLVVMSDVAAGEEVGNNYGPRNNEQCKFPQDYPRVFTFLTWANSDDELRFLHT